MILINIDTLTDSELRYIAEQENLENWESLSRKELIDELEELYGDDLHEASSPKYIQTLTTSTSNVLELPGVSPLPKYFNETYIHFVAIDSHWAYCFWYFSVLQFEQLKNEGAEITIKAVTTGQNGKEKSYEFGVSIDDNSWNLELPYPGMKYTLYLCAKVNGKTEILCKSNTIKREDPFIVKNPSVLYDPKKYKLLVSSMVSKSGECIDCSQVRKIIACQEKTK